VELLSGHELAQIDKQGRIVIPAAFRAPLKEEFYAFPDSRYAEGCLVLAPREWFEVMAADLKRRIRVLREKASAELDEQLLARADKWIAAYQYLLGSSKLLKMDGQGRVVLPESLLRIVGLNREMRVIVAGMGEVVKLWSQDAWKRFRSEVTGYYRFLLTSGELGGKGKGVTP